MAIPVQQLHVENFGCIVDQTVDFSPLTVLVGPNDSGKSMLLRALGSLAASTRIDAGWGGVFPSIELLEAQSFSKLAPLVFEIKACAGPHDDKYDYRAEIALSAFGERGHPYVNLLQERIQGPGLDIRRTPKSVVLLDRKASTSVEASWPEPPVPILSRAARGVLTNNTWAALGPLLDRLEPLLRALQSMRIYALRPESLRAPAPPGG